MRSVALFAIGVYQRRVSPYKGFCCAYRAHTGHASCSMLGLRAIRRFGVWRGLAVLRQRLARCGVAHRRYGPLRESQRGFIDLDCPVDCGPADSVCDPIDCCDGCDWPRRKNDKRKQDKDRTTRLPPQRWPGEERDRR